MRDVPCGFWIQSVLYFVAPPLQHAPRQLLNKEGSTTLPTQPGDARPKPNPAYRYYSCMTTGNSCGAGVTRA